MPMDKFPDTQKMKLSPNDTKRIKAHFDRIANFSNLSPAEKKRVYDVFLRKIENNVLHNVLEDTEAINAKKKMEEIKRKLAKILESLNLKISGKRLEILTNLLAKKILKEAAEAEKEKDEDEDVESINLEDNEEEKEEDEEEIEMDEEEEEEEEIELAKDIKEELEKTKEELENLKKEIELLRSGKNEEDVEGEIEKEIEENDEEIEEENEEKEIEEDDEEIEEENEEKEEVKEEEIPAMVEAIVQYSLPTLIEKASEQILKNSVIKKKIEVYNKLAESFGVKEFVQQVDKLNTMNEYLRNIIRVKNEEIDSLKEQLKAIKIKSIKEKKETEKRILLNRLAESLKRKIKNKIKEEKPATEETPAEKEEVTDGKMIQKEERGENKEKKMLRKNIASKIKERLLIKREMESLREKREKKFLLKKLSGVLNEKYNLSEKPSFIRRPLNKLNERSFLNLRNNSSLPVDNPEKMAKLLNESLKATNPIKLESLNQIKKLTE